MTSPSDLEVVRSETDVGLDTIGHATVLGQGTAGLVSAVTTFTDSNVNTIRLQHFTIVF